MNQSPKISVITPTKDRLKLLREAMDSVQAQTFADWEHLIIDDGSDDGTAEEVERCAKADPRVRYIKRTGDKAGANVCRNLGIGASRSDLIVFLDSDDLLMPNCLSRRLEIMQRNADLDFVVFRTQVFIKVPDDLDATFSQDLIGDDLLRFLYFENPWSITGPMWRKAALIKLGGFDETLPSWQDIDLHIRAIATTCCYIKYFEADHYVRWQFEPTKVSIEQRRSPRHLSSAPRLLEKFEQVIIDGPGMDWVRQRALCSLYFFVAELWVTAGDLSAALNLWRTIRRRSLGPPVLHLSGAVLLIVQAIGTPGRNIVARLTHKWKGWMRLRRNPELVGVKG
jgi:GT2 family glycosyltransferase